MPTSLQPIDYSSRDFASLLDDLRSLAPIILPEWTSQTPLDFGTALLELFAYVGDIQSYYIDRVANELFLATATRRQSIINIAALLNYTPMKMQAAQTSLTFTLAAGADGVVIPAGTQVTTSPQSGAAPLIFETNVDLAIAGANVATPQLSGSVLSTEGVSTTDEILVSSADGSPNQTYTLFRPNVIDGSVVISVLDANNVSTTWLPTHTLLTAAPGDRVYTASVDENDVVHILFGDNVHGLAPSVGSLVTATYRVGNGASGNISENQLIEMVHPIAGLVSVTNPSPAVGGVDEETTSSIRTSIPTSLRALNRAVTTDDYAALAVQVSGIAKAQAVATIYTSVLLYVAPVGTGGQTATGPDTLAGTQKYAVQRYLSDKKLINVTVTIADPLYIGVDVTATVHVLANFFQPTVQNAVLASLQRLLAYDNVDFGDDVTVSQVYHAIQATDGVDFVTLSLLVRSDAATHAGVQDVVLNTGEIPQVGALNLAMVGGVV